MWKVSIRQKGRERRLSESRNLRGTIGFTQIAGGLIRQKARSRPPRNPERAAYDRAERVSGLGLSPQLSSDRLSDCRPLAELIEKVHRANCPFRIDADRGIGNRASRTRPLDWPHAIRCSNWRTANDTEDSGDSISKSHAPVLPTALARLPPPAHPSSTRGWPRRPPRAHTSSGGRKYLGPQNPYTRIDLTYQYNNLRDLFVSANSPDTLVAT